MEEADAAPAVSPTTLLVDGIIAVALELDLPIALKIGAHRGVNPRLRSGGDGVRTVDLSFLRELLSAFPDLKICATVLSRENQHELAVLARKFGNLHVYGCWWFCNNPSIIESVTTMRMELLGTAFTAQHSDARVLDQLLYKWAHSRRVISSVLSNKFLLLANTGWAVRASEVEQAAHLLLGGAFEDFMSKR